VDEEEERIIQVLGNAPCARPFGTLAQGAFYRTPVKENMGKRCQIRRICECEEKSEKFGQLTENV
jgi:hypothetical protein